MRRIGKAVAIASLLVGCADGKKDTPAKQHEEQPATPLRVELTASAQSVQPGGAVELSWTVQGEGLLSVKLDGVDATGRSSVRVNPLTTTEFVLRARDATGSAEARVTVEVVPQIEPNSARVVAPGAQQEFWVAGATGPFDWSASDGTLDPVGSSAMWTAPTRPGTYTVRVDHAGGEIVHRVDVRAAPTAGAPLAGVLGQPDASFTEDVVAAGDGSLWALGQQALLRREPGSTVWTPANDGLDFQPMKIAAAPDGTAWVTGMAKVQNALGSRLALARWDSYRKAWVREPGPWENAGVGRSLSVRGDGAVVVGDSMGRVWARWSPGAEWVRLPDGENPSDLFLSTDGSLYARCDDTRECPSRLVRLGPDAAVWEPLPQTPRPAGRVGSDADDRIFAWGLGVLRLDASGTWEDLSAGLPLGSSGLPLLRALAHSEDRYFAATPEGIYVRADDGDFRPFAASPIAPSNRYMTESLLALGNGDLVLMTDSGMWRLPAGSTSFVPAGAAGDPAGGISVTALAFGRDGTVAVAATDRRAVTADPLLYVKAGGSDSWSQATIQTESGFSILQLVFEEGGLLARTELELLRVDPTGGVIERLELDGLPPRFRLQDIETTRAGTRYVVASGRLFELTDAGAGEVALPSSFMASDVVEAPDGKLIAVGAGGPYDRAFSVDFRDGSVEPLGVDAGSRSNAFETVHVSRDGDAWVASIRGALRLQDGAWRPAGSGPCSFTRVTLHVTDEGTAYCADGVHLYRFDGDASDWVQLSSPLRIGAITWNGERPTAMTAAPDGRLWLGFRHGGVFEYPAR